MPQRFGHCGHEPARTLRDNTGINPAGIDGANLLTQYCPRVVDNTLRQMNVERVILARDPTRDGHHNSGSRVPVPHGVLDPHGVTSFPLLSPSAGTEVDPVDATSHGSIRRRYHSVISAPAAVPSSASLCPVSLISSYPAALTSQFSAERRQERASSTTAVLVFPSRPAFSSRYSLAHAGRRNCLGLRPSACVPIFRPPWIQFYRNTRILT